MAIKVWKGWNAEIYVAGEKIGLANSVTIEIATGLEPYYEVGARIPAALVEGNQEITGTLSKAWVDKKFLDRASPEGELPSFEMIVYADKDKTAGSPYVILQGCKIETLPLDITQDGFLTEDVDYRARKVLPYEA